MWIHSCFVLHTGSKRLETDENSLAMALSVSWCLEPMMKHSPLFLTSNTTGILFIIVSSCFFTPFFVPGIHASTTRGGGREEF